MRNVALNPRNFILLACALALSACTKTPVDVSSLGLRLSAPQLKSTSPFNQEIHTQGYIEFTGLCSPLIDSFSVSADGTKFNQVPATTDYTVGGVTTTKTNDTDCADGTFSFYITEDQINTWLGHIMVDGEIKSLYVRGSGWMGDTEDLVLHDSKDGNHVATTLQLSKEFPRGFATNGECGTLQITLRDDRGSEMSQTTDTPFSVVEVPAGVIHIFDSIADCNTSANALTVSKVPAFSSQKQIFYRAAATPVSFSTYILSGLPGSLQTASITIQNRDPANATIFWAGMTNYPHTLFKNICYPASVQLRLYDSTSSSYVNHDTVAVLPAPSNPKLKFYFDSACSPGNEIGTALNIYNGTSNSGVYMKYVDVGTTSGDTRVNLGLTVTAPAGTSADVSVEDLWVDLDDSRASATQISVNRYDQITSGICYQYTAQLINSRWAPIPNPGPSSASVQITTTVGSNGMFYTSSTSCSSGVGGSPTLSANIPVSSSSVSFYFKSSSDGDFVMTPASGSLTSLVSPLRIRPGAHHLAFFGFATESPNYSKVFAHEGGRCVIAASGQLYCAGLNDFGQLGDSASMGTNLMTLTAIDPGNQYAEVSLAMNHTCGITTDGRLRCWGNNDYNKAGTGAVGVNNPNPADVDFGYVHVATGQYHTCGVKTNGDLYCWGGNAYGALGTGDTTDRPTPYKVGTGYQDVSAGDMHTCALKTDSNLQCWGFNSYGQVGNGTSTNASTPVMVMTGVTSVSVGGIHSCAILADQKLKCWGFGTSGQLGNGSSSNSLVPVYVSGGDNYVSVSASSMNTCGITTLGELKCWGMNSSYQLGNGTNTPSNSPVLVESGYVHVSSGPFSTCAVTGGELRCWGTNAFGQFGDGSVSAMVRPYPYANKCLSFELQLQDANNNPIAAASALNFNIFTQSSSGSFYNDSRCDADPMMKQHSTGVNFALGESSKTLYFRSDMNPTVFNFNTASGLGVPGTISYP